MKELMKLILKFDLKGLFLEPNDSGMIQFFRYAFVGGIASVVDWGVLWLAEYAFAHYLVAAIISFFAGLTVNFVLSKILVFKKETKMGTTWEYVSCAIIGGVGLLMTLGIMYALTEWIHFHFMLSKIIATAIVLIWNFFARKLLLYRG